MKEQAVNHPTQFLNQLSSLVHDGLHIVTYKFFSRKFNIPFDASKRLLYRYFSNNRDNIDATYFLSGWTSGASPQHVVKLVDQESLEKEKSSLSKVNSLHIYSIQPRRMATTESLYENDLSQSKIQGSAVKLVSLGRVCLDECWSMHQEGKPSPPKMQKACNNLDCPTRASAIHVGEEKEKAILKLKDASSRHADPQPVKKVEEKGGNHKESSQFTKTGNDSKRKMQVIDSDDECVANISVHGDKKFRTYINDNGEEVTDKKILTKQYAAEIMEKTNEASNRTMNAKIREPCPPVQKKSSKPKEQKTIASFFSKRN